MQWRLAERSRTGLRSVEPRREAGYGHVNLPDAIKHSNFRVVNETLVLDIQIPEWRLDGLFRPIISRREHGSSGKRRNGALIWFEEPVADCRGPDEKIGKAGCDRIGRRRFMAERSLYDYRRLALRSPGGVSLRRTRDFFRCRNRGDCA